MIDRGWNYSCLAQFYGRSRQYGCPVETQCSIGLGSNPLIIGLIQPISKLNFLFLEKKIQLYLLTRQNFFLLITSHQDVLEEFFFFKQKKSE